jgi:Protein of unknown function (DUF2905)
MGDRSSLGVFLMLAGLALLAAGGLFWLGALSWFGRLPGDIRVERDGFRFYVPLTSMILISIVLTLVLSLVRRFSS